MRVFLELTTKTSDLLLLDNGVLFSLGQGEEGRKGVKDSQNKTPALYRTKFNSAAPASRGMDTPSQTAGE